MSQVIFCVKNPIFLKRWPPVPSGSGDRRVPQKYQINRNSQIISARNEKKSKNPWSAKRLPTVEAWINPFTSVKLSTQMILECISVSVNGRLGWSRPVWKPEGWVSFVEVNPLNLQQTIELVILWVLGIWECLTSLRSMMARETRTSEMLIRALGYWCS